LHSAYSQSRIANCPFGIMDHALRIVNCELEISNYERLLYMFTASIGFPIFPPPISSAGSQSLRTRCARVMPRRPQ
jgi:hypothetical protein